MNLLFIDYGAVHKTAGLKFDQARLLSEFKKKGAKITYSTDV